MLSHNEAGDMGKVERCSDCGGDLTKGGAYFVLCRRCLGGYVPMGTVEVLRDAYEAYIGLLCEELEEVIPVSAAHGWKSKRYQAGVAARKWIEDVMPVGMGVKRG